MDEKIIKEIISKVMAKLGDVADDVIPLEVSGRHAHLSAEDVQTLFGHPLTAVRELSQPGQFLCQERVRLIGPKGVIDNVAVLGPVRSKTQVEVSLTDARILGTKAPVRQSGDTSGAAEVLITTETGNVALDQALIVPGRHIHMTPKDAMRLGVKDEQMVDVQVETGRSLVFGHVLVRVSEDYRLSMHIDFDEGNACGWSPKTCGSIVERQR